MPRWLTSLLAQLVVAENTPESKPDDNCQKEDNVLRPSVMDLVSWAAADRRPRSEKTGAAEAGGSVAFLAWLG